MSIPSPPVPLKANVVVVEALTVVLDVTRIFRSDGSVKTTLEATPLRSTFVFVILAGTVVPFGKTA